MEKFDIAVVGAGPGGYVAAIRAAQLGFNTVVVERAELGGVCLNWGCIPTKALLKSAQVYNYLSHLADYGLALCDTSSGENVKVVPVPQTEKIVERERNVAAAMSRGIEYLFRKNGITLVKGNAWVKARGLLEVVVQSGDNMEIGASHIILATGSRAASLPFAPIDGERIISYREALVPKKLPESLVVIGSGAIGCEMAFFYNSMGTKVTLIEYLDRILPLEDADVSAQLSRSFRKAGMKVLVSAAVTQVEKSAQGCRVRVRTGKGEEVIEAEQVLSAVGVVPNTENLGLENLGIELVKGKVPVDEYYRTKVEGIYAIGDIIATPALAHVASAEAVAAVEKIAGLEVEPLDYSNVPGAVYTSPEAASVGLTEQQAKEAGLDYKVGKFPFTASGKATASGERDGFVKLISDAASGKLLGAHLVGANVTEMISGIVLARKLGAGVRDIVKTIYPHPTMSEAIMGAAEVICGECIHL